jgi:hypothetical protein
MFMRVVYQNAANTGRFFHNRGRALCPYSAGYTVDDLDSVPLCYAQGFVVGALGTERPTQEVVWPLVFE